jgi:hypothetical protein
MKFHFEPLSIVLMRFKNELGRRWERVIGNVEERRCVVSENGAMFIQERLW